MANPEQEILLNKENYGVCYCGGGLRACVLTYGSISQIREKLKKVKYISGTSGSTWFIVSYIYYYDKIFFDNPISPEDCTLENIEHLEPNTFGQTLSTVNLALEFIKQSFQCDYKINKWIEIIYESFFKKYGNPDNQFNFSNYPYPLVQATIYYNDINARIFQLEFSPFNSNVPIFYIQNNIEYGGYIIPTKKLCTNQDIQPYAQAGISSAVFEGINEIITNGKYNGTEYDLFNPNTNQINRADLVDGGFFDNTGIIGLIRKKVLNIHINIYPSTAINDKNFMFTERYFTSLFKGNTGSEKRGIFPLGLWEEVYNRSIYKLNNGEPVTILLKGIKIESNEYFQIEGYETSNILFHISSRTAQWFDKLPKQTQLYIEERQCNFPYISPLKVKLENKIINLMYNLIKWDIENSPEYDEFYEYTV